MKNAKRIEVELRKTLFELLMPIQEDRSVNGKIYEEVHRYLEQLARELKGEDMVSKNLLFEIYRAINLLRAEAAYTQEEAGVNEMADKMEYIFGLILLDECPEDRQPGVPRIV